MFAADRRPIWCFNWYNNITIINNNVAADGKKVYRKRSISSFISQGLLTGFVYLLILLKD